MWHNFSKYDNVIFSDRPAIKSYICVILDSAYCHIQIISVRKQENVYPTLKYTEACSEIDYFIKIFHIYSLINSLDLFIERSATNFQKKKEKLSRRFPRKTYAMRYHQFEHIWYNTFRHQHKQYEETIGFGETGMKWLINRLLLLLWRALPISL